MKYIARKLAEYLALVLILHSCDLPPKVDAFITVSNFQINIMNDRIIRLEERETFYHDDGYGESISQDVCREDESNPVRFR